MHELRERALVTDGIDDMRGYESEDSPGTFKFRFSVRDDHALDALLDDFFSEADADIAGLFGESVETHSRILREESQNYLPGADHPNCLNCGTRLRGQYCGSCGQRARNRLISLWQLTQEAFGDLFELDSRLWRTLGPLLGRPGQLTRDYLEGRRARYMPPFRTYLVLSVIFFVVAFFNPRDDLGLLYEPEPEPTPEEVAAAEAEAALRAERRGEGLDEARKTMEQLNDQGLITDEALQKFIDEIEDDSAEADEDAESAEGADYSYTDYAGENDDSSPGFNVTIDEDGEQDANCTIDTGDLEKMPGWVQRRLTPERLEHICEEIEGDDGNTFVNLLLDNLPIALIVLLPVMALVLKILYPLSRRYFVEHLLFFVHFHAFFFLILTLQILLARIGSSLTFLPEAIWILIIIAASFYIPIYLYKAMRRVYGQGHLITIFKYFLLLNAYLIGMTFTLLGAMAFALMSL